MSEQCPVPVPEGYRLLERGMCASGGDVKWLTKEGEWISWPYSVSENYWKLGDDDYPGGPFFAIRIQQEERQMLTIKTWKPVISKWEPPKTEYKTLADVPEGVRCVVECNGWQSVRIRRGIGAQLTNGAGNPAAANFKFIQALDPVPEQPLKFSDLPDGRCVLQTLDNLKLHDMVFWQSGGTTYGYNKGVVQEWTPTYVAQFTVLDLVMEPIEASLEKPHAATK